MVDDEIMDAFYTGRRSSTYPLAVNDVVLVKEGRKSGTLAAVISVESVAPAVSYLVEYGDGSDDIVPLIALELKEPIQPPQTTTGSSAPGRCLCSIVGRRKMKFTITPLSSEGVGATSEEKIASVGEVFFQEMRRCFFGVIPPLEVLNATLREGEIVDTHNRWFRWAPFELLPCEYVTLKEEVLAHPQWKTEVDESFVGTVDEWSHWALVRAVSK